MNVTRRTFGLGALGLAASLAACGGSGTDDSGSATADASSEITLVTEGTLTVASDLAYPPLETTNADTGEAEGFSIDMMDAIAQKLGLELEYLPAQKFDTIIPLIKQGGKADVGVASFTITDERLEEIDFSDPYMDSNQSIVVASDFGYTSTDDLDSADIKVAVQSGTTGEEWVKENLPNAQCVPLDDLVQCFTGVQSGLYQAIVADLPPCSYMCTNSYTDLEVVESIPTGEQYGIVVSKDNPALTAAINDALAELEADGTIAELEVKWFGDEL